eukprot:TRINITY_DN4541_c4_g1_i1.p1 TRINITY_DN4541_c4_g1~~TRINITY_DN4541_c4_g1_i1.p1  ORF type:complete len:530 (+),score=63.42 TRINITY_DN4541_c4_g1_i1:130-1719(+)
MSGTELEIMEAVSRRLEQDKRLIQAILRKDAKNVERLLEEEGMSPDGHPLSLKGPPLHLAVQLGSTHIVHALVNHGANIDNTQGPFCTTGFRAKVSPLHLAVKAKNSWMIKKLISLGASADIPDTKGYSVRQLVSDSRSLSNILKEAEQAFHAQNAQALLHRDISNLRQSPTSLSCSNLLNKHPELTSMRSQSFSKTQHGELRLNNPSPILTQYTDSHPYSKHSGYQHWDTGRDGGVSLPPPHPLNNNNKNNNSNNNNNNNENILMGRLRKEHQRRSTIFRELGKLTQFVENQMSVVEAEKKAHLAGIARSKQHYERHDKILAEQVQRQSPYKGKEQQQQLLQQLSQQQQQLKQPSSSSFYSNLPFRSQTPNPLLNGRVLGSTNSSGVMSRQQLYQELESENESDQGDFKTTSIQRNQVRNLDEHSSDDSDRDGDDEDVANSSVDDLNMVSPESMGLASELTLSPQVSTDLRDLANSRVPQFRRSRPQVPKLDLSRLGLGKNPRKRYQQHGAIHPDNNGDNTTMLQQYI